MNKRTINLNIEITIDSNRMAEDKLTIEDIKNQLIFIEDDVLDGYVLTRLSEDNTEQFYINGVHIM